MDKNHLVMKQAIINGIFLLGGTTIIYFSPFRAEYSLWKMVIICALFQFLWTGFQRICTIIFFTSYLKIRSHKFNFVDTLNACHSYLSHLADTKDPALVSMTSCLLGFLGKQLIKDYSIMVMIVIFHVLLINVISYCARHFKK